MHILISIKHRLTKSEFLILKQVIKLDFKMIFSRATEYAVQAMLYLAKTHQSDSTKRVLTKEISESHNIPYFFLAKIIQDLSKGNLITSMKGPNGGLSLAEPPSEITLFDVLNAVDSTRYLDQCVIGFPKCKEDTPCPLHYEWKRIKFEVFELLKNKTLSSLTVDAIFIDGRLMIPPTIEGLLMSPNDLTFAQPRASVSAKNAPTNKRTIK